MKSVTVAIFDNEGGDVISAHRIGIPPEWETSGVVVYPTDLHEAVEAIKVAARAVAEREPS